MGCTNECRKWFSKEHCDYCQSNYVVSKERYVGKREANGAQVYGYAELIKVSVIMLNVDWHDIVRSYTDITSPDEANTIFKGLYNKYVKL